ncbi:MAG: M13 family metallopeptidase [Eikenella sp.]|nr:M13 family metallopeptidase [Eikenella sp.]
MKAKPLSIVIAALMAAGLAACGNQAAEQAKEQVEEAAHPVASAAPASGENKPMEVGEKPRLQDDFYTHVNYDYLTKTKLPADKAEVNNMTALGDEVEEELKDVLKGLEKNYANLKEGSTDKKVADFYKMASDFKTRNELGMKPVQPYLDQVKAVKTIEEFNALNNKLFLVNYTPTVSMGVAQDLKDSTVNILMLGKPELGLDKEYLEGKDGFSQNIRKAYSDFMKAVFVESGYSEAEAGRKAGLVMDLETKLAAAQLSKEEEIDKNKQYNVMSLQEIAKLVPNTAYVDVIKANGLDKSKKILVLQPAALQKLNELNTAENLEALKSQMEMNIVQRNSMHLHKKLIELGAKYVAAYTGVEHVDADDKLAFQTTNGKFGEMLGKAYVEKNFLPKTKEDVVEMTKAIRDTYSRRIKELDWLSPETKARAQKKLDTMVLKIGYPDKWKDYSSLVVKPQSAGGNLVEAANAVNEFEAKRSIAQLNQAPDRTEWQMKPQDINAYYNPLANEIVFPAGILQTPFYSPKAARAENLGGIGAVIGHEMSHAFDSTGAQFDEKGNLNNWWTEKDLAAFQEKVKQAAAIYSAIEAAPGYHVNGEISTGEIMADLGGLTVVLDIAKREGLNTKDVFNSYAKVWRNVSTQQALIAGLTDEHPPGKYRINNIVNLMDAFYTDYDVKEGDKMYVAADKRLRVW